jgi:hypothetical protein
VAEVAEGWASRVEETVHQAVHIVTLDVHHDEVRGVGEDRPRQDAPPAAVESSESARDHLAGAWVEHQERPPPPGRDRDDSDRPGGL